MFLMTFDFTELMLNSLGYNFLPGTLYDGEKFQLEFKFGSRYPFESPEVTNMLKIKCSNNPLDTP